MVFMKLAQELSDLRSQHFLHQNLLGPDHVDFDIPGTKRRGDLKANEARTNYNRTLRRQSPGDKRPGVSQSSQIMHVWKSRTRDIETYWRGSGSKQERFIGVAAAICELNLPASRVDCRYARAQVQIDFTVFIESRRSERVRTRRVRRLRDIPSTGWAGRTAPTHPRLTS